MEFSISSISSWLRSSTDRRSPLFERLSNSSESWWLNLLTLLLLGLSGYWITGYAEAGEAQVILGEEAVLPLFLNDDSFSLFEVLFYSDN